MNFLIIVIQVNRVYPKLTGPSEFGSDGDKKVERLTKALAFSYKASKYHFNMRTERKTRYTAERDTFIAERVSFGSVNYICCFLNAMGWFMIGVSE